MIPLRYRIADQIDRQIKRLLPNDYDSVSVNPNDDTQDRYRGPVISIHPFAKRKIPMWTIIVNLGFEKPVLLYSGVLTELGVHVAAIVVGVVEGWQGEPHD